MQDGYIVETVSDKTRANEPLVKRKFNDDLDELVEYICGYLGLDDIHIDVPRDNGEFEVEIKQRYVFTIKKIEYKE